jgi:uncharacterized tellurite resistance protein B-like protein/GTPase SAR1 family protein
MSFNSASNRRGKSAIGLIWINQRCESSLGIKKAGNTKTTVFSSLLLILMISSINQSKPCQSDVLGCLSDLLDRPIHENEFSDLLVFMTVLSSVLMGVAAADGEVTLQEKQHLDSILRHFIPSGNPLLKLAKEIFTSLRKHRTYLNPGTFFTLTGVLDESERLLIIALGCEIAIVDGSVDSTEDRYLQNLTQQFCVEPTLLYALQRGLLGESCGNDVAERYLYSLLDPARFRGLDPVFSKAAEAIVAKLPGKQLGTTAGYGGALEYRTLGEFHQKRTQLLGVCSSLSALLSECESQIPLSRSLVQDTELVAQHLLEKRFRVAVVGEFSQGKSTLLNAMLGEEIQPVRAIPCSGAISILKYGLEKRVTCRYKDGRTATIPIAQYQELVSISETAALNGLSDELEKSEIAEVIFEHPGLEICRQGVEVIDSPGLNEHPDRTRITHQLIAQADAVIFLANAARPLTQGEKELLKSLKDKLSGDVDKPANNLFVVVNFMDLLRRENDRRQVQQLVENFVCGDQPLVTSRDHLHFISAQAALDAMLDGEENNYLTSFRSFTQALEGFFTNESGHHLIQKTQRQLWTLGQSLKMSLEALRHNLDGKFEFSATERHQVLEKIGQISGRSEKIKDLISAQCHDANLQLEIEWQNHWKKLIARVTESSRDWVSKEKEAKKITQDFSECFANASSCQLELTAKLLSEEILTPHIESVFLISQEEIQSIRELLLELDMCLDSKLHDQYELSLSFLTQKLTFSSPNGIHIESNERNQTKLLWTGLGVAAGAALAVMSAGLTLIPGVLVGGYWGWMGGGLWGIFKKIDPSVYRQKVLEVGLQQLSSQEQQIYQHIIQEVNLSFYKLSSEIQANFLSVITLLNDLLSKRDQAFKQSAENRQLALLQIQEYQLGLENQIRKI